MLLNYFLLVFLTFLLFELQPITVVANIKKNIVCYHGSWSFHRQSVGQFDIASHLDPFLCTHLIYAFVGLDGTGKLRVKDPQLDLSYNEGHGNFEKLNRLKLKNPNLKILLSVGGTQSSENFSITASDPIKRSAFLASALNLLDQFCFDGLDLDWEYPNRYHKHKENDDRGNFVTLLKMLKTGFDIFGYLLTAAIGPAEYSPELSYNVSEISKYLDLINVMAYDLHGPWENVVGHNAPLYAGPLEVTKHAKQHSFDALAKYWISQGASPKKLIMGIPFYGRSYTLKDSHNYEVGAEHVGRGIGGQYTKQLGIVGYNELCELLKMDTYMWHYQWDPLQMVPFVHSNSQWISYDNETSISLKVDYVNRNNLGGIMIWTMELDDFRSTCGAAKHYPLLTAINDRLKGHEK